MVGNQSVDVPSLLAVDYKSAVRNTGAGRLSHNKDGCASRLIMTLKATNSKHREAIKSHWSSVTHW